MAAGADDTLRLEVACDLGELERIREPIDGWLKGAGACDRALYAAHLATEEIVSNIVKYGRARRIDLTLERHGEMLRLTVEDDGSEFDPTAVRSETDPTAELRSSGRGLLLVRSMVESMCYQRTAERNRLCLEILGREPWGRAGGGDPGVG